MTRAECPLARRCHHDCAPGEEVCVQIMDAAVQQHSVEARISELTNGHVNPRKSALIEPGFLVAQYANGNMAYTDSTFLEEYRRRTS